MEMAAAGSIFRAGEHQQHCTRALSDPLTFGLVATNSKPPVNIIMDKFTHQHVTRQLAGVITIVPDSPQLIQALYLGAPIYV